jgi:predicted nucleic acid-binding protein
MSANAIIYWDTSAILSTIFEDAHSDEARRRAQAEGLHLLSTLGWAECHGVIARLRRERALADVLLDAACEALDSGPWRRTNSAPSWSTIAELALRSPLRGADLWHLGLAVRLRADRPELTLLTYDERLAAAARAEGLLYS